MNRFKSLSHPLWFWTVSWFHAVSEGDYVSTSINRKWLWRIVSHDPIYTQKIDDLNVHFVPVTRYHYLVSNLRLTNTYLPCEQDFTNCNQFCTMWKNNNMWTYFHNEFFPIYQSNSNIFNLMINSDCVFRIVHRQSWYLKQIVHWRWLSSIWIKLIFTTVIYFLFLFN